MKRLIVFTVILLFVCGCSKIEKATPIVENISCVAEVEYNYSNYVCNLNFLKNELVVTIMEPNEISGLVLKINQDNVATEFKGITDAPEFNDLPQYSFVRILFDVINSVKGKDIEFNEDNGVICGEIGGYKYGFVFSPSGLPQSLSIDDINLKIYFKEISLR